MTTDVALFDNKGLPAHLADLNETTNIVVRESIPQLSFRGKVWRTIVGGEESIVYKTVSGVPTEEPAQVVAGVILDYNKARSRAYFEGAYVEGQSAAPKCWSHDGVVPHESVAEKQAATCATCEWSKKGSKVTDAGKDVAACSQFKRVAFLPIQNTKHPALLLKLPQTSIWDKDAEEFAAKGWYAFDQYLDLIKRRGVNHTAAVVTKIKFDPRTSYPKLLFGPLDWTPSEVVDDVKAALADTDGIGKILNVAPDATTPGDPVEAAAKAAQAAPAKSATKPKAAPAPAPAPAPSSDDDDAELMGAANAAPAAPAKPATKPATKPAAKPAAAATAPAPAVQVVEPSDAKSGGIANLLSEWENE